MKTTIRTASTALIAAGLLLAIPAQAHKKSYPTTTTAASKNKNFFEGNLAPNPAAPLCLTNRLVSVYNGASVLLGQARTDPTGKWQINSSVDIAPGTYYVTVSARRILKNRRHKHLCSGTARIPFQAI